MMKKNYLLPLAFGVFTLTFSSCEQKQENTHTFKTVKYKKKKRDPNKRHKKGIEHMADYQNSIRKDIDAENSTYKTGNILNEFLKAKTKKASSRKTSTISPTFIERGPINVPGRTRTIAVDPTDTNKWYAGTVGGGVWLTKDNGSSWENLTDYQIPNLATANVVVSQSNPNTIYVGTGEPFGNLDAIGGAGLFKSTDSGTNWSQINDTENFGAVGRIVVNPQDENNVVVGTTSGVYTTTDGGANWSRTSNLGVTQDIDADPEDFNTLYASVREHGILKSTDAGQTWVTIFNKDDFNDKHKRFETTVSPANSNVIYLSVYSSSGATTGVNTDFYISRDKGTTFTNLTTTGTAKSANLLTGQGWYDNTIIAHPNDENVFYVGGVAVFKVTVNNSSFTSQQIASGYDRNGINKHVHVDQHGLFAIKGDANKFRLMLCNDGGIYTTDFKVDPGSLEDDWSKAVTNKNSTQFYGATKQNGQDNYLAGAQDNGSWLSTGNNSDKNKKYQRVFGGDGFEVVWHYDKPGNLIVSSQTNNFARYINGQGAISNFDEGGDGAVSPFYTKISNADNNPDVVFAVSKSGVWKSTDFGGNWKLTKIPSNYSLGASSALNVEVSSADPNIVWAGNAMTESGSYSLHLSQDNGESFTKVNSFLNPNRKHNQYLSGIAPSYVNRERAYALFSGQGVAKIIKTEDLGQSWTDISGFATSGTNTSGFPDVAVHCALEMPFDENIIWVGTDIGIFATENGGTSWELVDGFIPVAVYDMKIVNNQVVIATHGRGVWSATINELNNFELAEYLKISDFVVSQKDFDSSKALVSYPIKYDGINKVIITVDGVSNEITQNFTKGQTYEFETNQLTDGNHEVGIQIFNDTKNLKSSILKKEVSIINFKTPSEILSINEFNESDIYTEGENFKLDNVDGKFSSVVLNNADHPYKDNTTYSVILRQPLIITQNNKEFKYEDIAFIEPYTDDLTDLTKFYDYVTVEASKDLKTWTQLDKYDSRRFTEWLDNYENSTNITDALFKEQTINLLDNGFAEGDKVIFKLSLVSDPGTNSFGWAIKSINKSATASVDEVLADKKLFTLYPTVSNGNFTLFSKKSLGTSSIKIFDVRGKEVFSTKRDFSSNQYQEINTSVQSGVYFVKILGKDNKSATEKIIIK